MLDVLRLIPKLNVHLMVACKAKNVQVEFQRTASGYSHTYFDATNIPLGILSEFPSDHDIAQATVIAYDEANALWDLLGYYHTNSDNPTPQTTPDDPTTAAHHDQTVLGSNPNEDTDTLDESEAFDRCALQEALACLNFTDQEEM